MPSRLSTRTALIFATLSDRLNKITKCNAGAQIYSYFEKEINEYVDSHEQILSDRSAINNKTM